MGKGEIARHEQFLLFPQCFQKACFPGASKGVTVWEWVNKESQSFVTIIIGSVHNTAKILIQNSESEQAVHKSCLLCVLQQNTCNYLFTI